MSDAVPDHHLTEAYPQAFSWRDKSSNLWTFFINHN